MLTPTDFLTEIRNRGARRLTCVRFRQNRSTVWSLTQRGTALNVHAAYAAATPTILDAFATLAIEGGVGSRRSQVAARLVSEWPDVVEAIEAARRAHLEGARGAERTSPTRCCATPEQRAYLQSLYAYLNATRFGSRLPSVPVRLSRRMRSTLGHMLPDEDAGGARRVAEIALNVDLMLEGNGAERIDTLLHEMAHAADYLESGARGHGPTWRSWARRVGCRPTTLYDRPVRARRRKKDPVLRVPPLPPALLGAGPDPGLERTDAHPDRYGHSQPKAPAVRQA